MRKKADVNRAVLSFCLACCLLALLTVSAGAAAASDGAETDFEGLYEAQYEAAGVDALVDILDEETLQYLKTLGIDGADFETLSAVSPSVVLTLIMGFVQKGIREPLRALGRVAAVMAFSAVCGAFVTEENERLLFAVSGGTAVLCLFSSLYETMKAATACIGAAAAFEKLLIPVLAGILTASGNPASALGFGTIAFAAAQGMAALSQTAVLPLCSASLALVAAGALCPALKLGTVGEQIMQLTRKLFGFGAALFSGLLGLKEMMAKPADSLLNKGIRLAAGSFLPVVGNAVSEAYGTVVGSFSLLAATVGGFGIAAVAVICLPVITELLVWFFVLKGAETAAGVMGLSAQSALYKSFAAAVSLLNILVVYTVLIFVISSGIVLITKG